MSQDETSAEKTPPIERVHDDAHLLAKVQRYMEAVSLEVAQVSWPSWKQVWSTTFVVLFFTLVVTVFIAVIGWIAEFFYRLVLGG